MCLAAPNAIIDREIERIRNFLVNADFEVDQELFDSILITLEKYPETVNIFSLK